MCNCIIQFIKFGLVGLSNTAISYGTYALLTFLGLYYVIANVIAFVVSVLNSFFWNNRYVFKKNENEKRNTIFALIKTFIAYGSTGLVLSNVLLVLLVENFSMNKYIAPVLILMVTIPLNFIINKFWAFKTEAIIESNSKDSPNKEIEDEKN